VASDSGLLAAVRDARRRLASFGPEHVRAAGDFERVSLPLQDGDVLRDLLLAEHARVVVEIGLAYGSSALAIAEALLAREDEQAKHVIIDPYQHLRVQAIDSTTRLRAYRLPDPRVEQGFELFQPFGS
jgi:predicted O-methyltransferase YrrM